MHFVKSIGIGRPELDGASVTDLRYPLARDRYRHSHLHARSSTSHGKRRQYRIRIRKSGNREVKSSNPESVLFAWPTLCTKGFSRCARPGQAPIKPVAPPSDTFGSCLTSAARRMVRQGRAEAIVFCIGQADLRRVIFLLKTPRKPQIRRNHQGRVDSGARSLDKPSRARTSCRSPNDFVLVW